MRLIIPYFLIGFVVIFVHGAETIINDGPQLPEKSYNILVLLPVTTKSHYNVFLPVVEALADRGHKIVMLSPFTKSKHPNILEEVTHLNALDNADNLDMFSYRGKASAHASLFKEILPKVAHELYQLPKVKELYARRKEFDLIVINHMFNEMAYPFAYEMPFITIATVGYDPRQSAVLGNVPNPSYMPNVMGGCSKYSGVFGRVCDSFFHVLIPFFWRNLAIVPLIQAEITKTFPELPPLLDIERNQSLTLMNTHFSMTGAIPLLPSQVEIGGMHCRPGQPLPQDINSWIEGAGSPGVVYFSLGSVAKGVTMPKKYRDMLIEAFSRMKQRILWKFEADLEGIPENIMISKWLPQQDILAHPNVKVFITHAGLLSTQEAYYHGTPVLALPIFGDQERNADQIVDNGIGLSLVWEKLTVDLIKNSLEEIITNPKYRKRVQSVSQSFRDQPDTAKDRAIFWTEYVIRNQGGPALKCSAVELSWTEFLLLDVFALTFCTIVIGFIIICWIIKICLRKLFQAKEKRKEE